MPGKKRRRGGLHTTARPQNPPGTRRRNCVVTRGRSAWRGGRRRLRKRGRRRKRRYELGSVRPWLGRVIMKGGQGTGLSHHTRREEVGRWLACWGREVSDAGLNAPRLRGLSCLYLFYRGVGRGGRTGEHINPRHVKRRCEEKGGGGEVESEACENIPPPHHAAEPREWAPRHTHDPG